MFSLSRITRTVPPWLAALTLVCAAATLGPGSAQAQKAGDLDCKKCVDADDIAKKAITKSQIEKETIKSNRFKEGAVTEAKLSTGLQDHVAERESFYTTIDVPGGATSVTQTIATHGPLTVFARCLLNQPIGAGQFEDRLEIVVTSTTSGWFEDDFSDEPDGNRPFDAGDQVISESESVNPPGSAFYDNLEASVSVAPDGSYLALDGDTGGMGMNIFGHDCVVMGNIYRITGTL